MENHTEHKTRANLAAAGEEFGQAATMTLILAVGKAVIEQPINHNTKQ